MFLFVDTILEFKGLFLTSLAVFLIYFIAKKILDSSSKGKSDWTLVRSIVLFMILLIGIVAIIMSLPMSDTLRGQVTALIGIVISAVLALSSATFIGNALAGIMIRMINSFKPGDFIQVNEYFGRISERGLFHTEIQTENRDLTTIPNLYLATNAVRVTRSTGTFISGVCSLGYDVNRQKIETALLDAAQRADLEDPFVRITELGDFSVVYTVFGMLKEIKTVLSAQSKLNAMMLDALHDANIEIVSPNFMNQRQVGETVFIPQKVKKHEEVVQSESPENKIFDKADEAESIEKRKEKMEEVNQKLKTLAEELKSTPEEEKEAIKARIEKWTVIQTKLLEKVAAQQEELSKKK